MGKRALFLFQIAFEESEMAADLFAQPLGEEKGRRQPGHFMPVKRA
jgi:hypothetical protein